MDDSSTGMAKSILNLRPRKPGEVSPMKGKKLSKNYWTWAKKMGGPESFVEPMRRIFKINRQTPISLEFAIVLKIGLEALKGDTKCMEMWVDRIYGKVPQSMDIQTKSDGPLVQILNVLPGEEMKPVIDVPAEPLAIPETYPTMEE
ncbi:MAG: hypothetical protein KKG09_09450 [Verrucomicrobia bacterium]|nr:hypothetical protein [Verrucomicrobiota bacterium]MCG2678400.1 hypothetical protein [Kiritimatiellia bacterium]MBU4247221.1 hypothetical protein [Verrucomicrobiota bacterium]MBU4291829.1 hypothetical protein [Verrucomicrobiota bacterium]MBU4430390.1 hypothetical protein [Verrucomicrobiota bacterium]